MRGIRADEMKGFGCGTQRTRGRKANQCVSLLAGSLVGVVVTACCGEVIVKDDAAGAQHDGKVVVSPDIPRDKLKFYLFLLAGQSNMAGRGKVDPHDKDNEVHPHIWMMDKDGQWVPAKDPVHFDRPTAGVGPAMSFARELAEKKPDVHIGLIPCAQGATALSQWNPKSALFKRAVERTDKGLESGTIKGILWHQGESNTVEGPWKRAEYEKGLADIVAAFRREFKAPDLPFIAGELGLWFKSKNGENVADFNMFLQSMEDKIVKFGCVSAEGFKTDDGLHFNAGSQRMFGQRYAEKYFKLEKSKP